MSEDHPLLMQGLLVRGTLEGRKTQTRRPIKCGCNEVHKNGNPVQLFGDRSLSVPPHSYDGTEHLFGWIGKRPEIGEWIETVQTDVDDCLTSRVLCPLGKTGDRLWVRETFISHPACPETGRRYSVIFKADGGHPEGYRWTPSIHMPRKACRLVLPLVSVRAERTQDITEDDAKAEGVEPIGGSYREGFRSVWQSIYGTWDLNPWVWVAEWKEIILRGNG